MKNLQVGHSTQQMIPKHLKMSNYSYFCVFGYQKFRNCHYFVKIQKEFVFTAKKEAYILRTISEGHYGPCLSNALGFESFHTIFSGLWTILFSEILFLDCFSAFRAIQCSNFQHF